MCSLNTWWMPACPSPQEHLIFTWRGVPHTWVYCSGFRGREGMPPLCVPQDKEVIGAVPWQFCVLKFCMLQLSFPESFVQYFTVDTKGIQCDFFHCLMHRSIWHRQRIQVFSKLTLASCTRRSQNLSPPKLRSDRVIQAGRESRRSTGSTFCSKQGYVSLKRAGDQSQCLNDVLHREWRQRLNLSALR